MGQNAAVITLRHIYHTLSGLADYGQQLPAPERLAWRTLAGRLEAIADQELTWPEWMPPDEAVKSVQGLQGDFQAMNTHTSAPATAARWLAWWLAEQHDNARRHRQPTPAGREEPPSLASRGWSRWVTAATVIDPDQWQNSWAILRISGATPITVADDRRLIVISSAAELSCVADRRPWRWRKLPDGVEIRVGEAPEAGQPSGWQLALQLEHLARGLDPGGWQVSLLRD